MQEFLACAGQSSGASLLSCLAELPAVDQSGVEERVARLFSRSVKKEAKVKGLLLALSMIDLTSLDARDTQERIRQLCHKAVRLHDDYAGLPHVAAVCVYPQFVTVAKKALAKSGVKVACVTAAFPAGMAPLELKLEETKRAAGDGADEIDMVISRGKFLAGDYSYVLDEVSKIKQACGEAHLKVIIESGELSTLDNVRKASELAMLGGADFIKTSTGKIKPAATPQVTLVMLEAIRDYYYRSARRVGMKPAGGIGSAKQALQYLVMLRETLGQDWLTPALFRFGASKLANDILMQLMKEKTGRYQSIDYFSLD